MRRYLRLVVILGLLVPAGAQARSATRVVGLTGGIASGKSTVSKMLSNLGAKVVDADRIARQIVRPGRVAHREIVRNFGREMLKSDGTLDRKRLGQQVFTDPQKMQQLNRITHPRIAREARREIRMHRKAGAPLVVYDAALLVETGWYRDRRLGLDGLVVVNVPEKVQIQRLRQRDGLTASAARRRIRAQLPLSAKLKVADHVIDNSGSLEQTQQQVRSIWNQLTGAP